MGFFDLPRIIHVIGSGLSGLSSAVHLSNAGATVFLYDAASYAGGRCRSYFDSRLGQRIDNGNHLVLTGNECVGDYLKIIDSVNSMWVPPHAKYKFSDLYTGENWSVNLENARIPWSLLRSSKRVPDSSIWEYIRGIKLAWAGEKTVAQCLDGKGSLFLKFWKPFAVSVLNTEAELASGALLWPVLKQTFGRGGSACRPMISKHGLSETFVDPALRFVKDNGGKIKLGERLKSLVFCEDKLTQLCFSNGNTIVKEGEGVILALPSGVAKSVVPGLSTPTEFRPIINGHFNIPKNYNNPYIVGLCGGVCHWVFVRGSIASVTISAANAYIDMSAEEIAKLMWPEICNVLNLGGIDIRAYRILKEKRATFAQTPVQLALRPKPQTKWPNLVLAGDWIDTGLPATIEGSLKSGVVASKLILNQL